MPWTSVQHSLARAATRSSTGESMCGSVTVIRPCRSAISFGATVVWVLLLLTSVGKHFGVGRSDDLQAPLNQAAPTAASW